MTDTELIKSLVPVIPSPKMKIDAKVSRTDIVNIVHGKLVAKAEVARELAHKEYKEYTEKIEEEIPKILQKVFKRSVLALKALGLKGEAIYNNNSDYEGGISMTFNAHVAKKGETRRAAHISLSRQEVISLAPELGEMYKAQEKLYRATVKADEIFSKTMHNKSNINVALAESILNSSDQGKQMLEQLDQICDQFDDKLNNRQLKQ